jgi:glycosyltransferase involved in cell wall biosynthesis
MKILMVGTFTFPYGGGAAARAVHMQALGLAGAGHDVTVAAAISDGPAKRFTMDGFLVRSFGPYEVATASGGIAQIRNFATRQLLLAWFVAEAIIRRRYDSIIFYGLSPLFALLTPFARLWKQRTAVVLGDLASRGVERRLSARLKRAVVVLTERVMVRSTSLTVVGGSSVLERKLRDMAPRTPTIRSFPPTDMAAFSNGDAARSREQYGLRGKKVIAYAGRINRLEGVDVLLKAMRLVADEHPDAVLVIAGSAATVDPIVRLPLDYPELARGMGIADLVVFTGFLPMQGVVDLLAAADVLVSPKIDHPANVVAAPIKVGEYLASGRPVVATRICELDEWLRDGEDVVFCATGDVDGLAAALSRVLSDPERGRLIGASGRERARSVCDASIWADRVAGAL